MIIRLRYLAIALVILGVTLYFPALNNHFVWDDEEQVLANSAVHSVANIPSLLAGSTFNSGGAGAATGLYYKPLMSICFAILYTLFGADPLPFHAFQIVLHLGSTFLLFLILLHLTKRWPPSFFASLIFLIHPMNVETVVYISALQDTLYMFFGLFALFWLTLSTKYHWYDYLLVSLLLLLSILGKETGLLFYGLTGLYLLLFRSRSFLLFLPYAGASLALYLYLRLGLAGIYLEKNYFTPIATLPLASRLLSLPKMAWYYLGNFVYPARLAISQHWVVTTPSLVDFFLPLAGLLILLGMLTSTLIAKGKSPLFRPLLFFTVWFLVAFLFHLQLFPLDMTVADRWFYLPMAGLLGLFTTLFSKFKLNPILITSCCLLIALFSFRSRIRIDNWQDGLTLYSHDVQLVQGSFDLENNLGVELFRAGKYKEAKAHFESSTQIAPSWWTNWNNLGAVVEREGDLDTAANYYHLAITNGNYYLAYGNYARILIKQGEYAQAQHFITASLQYFPASQELRELNRYLQTTYSPKP